jgi:hypothetical protein
MGSSLLRYLPEPHILVAFSAPAVLVEVSATEKTVSDC